MEEPEEPCKTLRIVRMKKVLRERGRPKSFKRVKNPVNLFDNNSNEHFSPEYLAWKSAVLKDSDFHKQPIVRREW